MSTNQPPLTLLRQRWLLTAILYFLALFAAYLLLRQDWPHYATRWAAVVVGVLTLELAVLWRCLPLNRRRRDGQLLAGLGYGNALTLTRGGAIGLLAGFLFLPPPAGPWRWTPAALYTLAIILDFFDGYVARRTNHTTVLGEILDMEFDTLGFAAAALLAIGYGHLPLWYLPLGFARPLFLLGLWGRRRQNLPVHPLPPSDLRRLIAGYQMAFISVALWPTPGVPVTTVSAVLFALPFVFSFGRDWLVTSGWLEPDSKFYQRANRWLHAIFLRALPLAARIVGSLLLIWLLATQRSLFSLGDSIDTQSESAVGWLLLLLAATLLLGGAFFLLGWQARITATPLLAVAMLDITGSGLSWLNATLLVCALWVLHMGGGALSLHRLPIGPRNADT